MTEKYRIVARDNFGPTFDETYDDFDEVKDKLVEVLMEYGETCSVDLEFIREGEE
jgi:hypothetical protein